MNVKGRMSLPEYQEYVLVLMEYKRSQSKHSYFLNNSGHLETSSNPLDRARFYDEKARNSKMCKKYYEVKKRYIQAVALASLEEVELDTIDTAPSPEILAQLRGIASAPTSMADIIAAEKESGRQQEAQKITGQDLTMRKMTREFCAMNNKLVPEWLHEYDEEDGITIADDEIDFAVSSENKIIFDKEFDKL